MAPVDPTTWDSIGKDLPDPKKQDCLAVGDAKYKGRYGYDIGCHQMWPGEGASAGWTGWKNKTPLVYQIKGAGRRPQLHLVAGAADQQLRQERHAARERQREPAQPAREHDLRLQRDLPGPADQRRVRPRRARALREPPGREQRLRPPGLRRAELLVPDAPPQRPHRARVGRPAALRRVPLRPATAASRTRRRGSPASTSTSCTSATRPAATTARSSRSSGSTTTSTASPAPTSTRAWSA